MGVINPFRATPEAIAGKNLTHPGKLYNFLAKEIAKELTERLNLREVYVTLVSEIGKPLNEPRVFDVKFDGNVKEEEIRRIADEIFESRIEKLVKNF